jgi:hypothetical protein
MRYLPINAIEIKHIQLDDWTRDAKEPNGELPAAIKIEMGPL